MADLILYGFPQSNYVRAARMACVEKGVPYTLEPVRPHSPPILEINPFGKMPAMRHGDSTLYETSAILRYIDDTFDGPRLTPTDKRQRAKMEQWISAINAYYDNAIMRRLVLQYIFPSGADGKPDRAIVDKAAEEVKKQIAILDAALVPGPYLLGADISLADLLLCPIMVYLSQTPEGGKILKTTKNVPRAGQMISARKSYQDTVPPPPPPRA